MTLSFVKPSIAAAGFATLALTAMPVNATFFGPNDGPAIGIGTACAALLENVARQPEAEDELTTIYREAADTILAGRYGGLRDVPQGIALYKVAQIEGIAQQPEAEGTLTAVGAACQADLDALRSFRPDRAAVAIGEMCAQLLVSIGRQPEAEDKLLAAYGDGVEQIAALRPRSSAQVKAEGFGIAKAGQIEGVARQPEVADKLASAAATCKEDILSN